MVNMAIIYILPKNILPTVCHYEMVCLNYKLVDTNTQARAHADARKHTLRRAHNFLCALPCPVY